jgi:hypothetical protein
MEPFYGAQTQDDQILDVPQLTCPTGHNWNPQNAEECRITAPTIQLQCLLFKYRLSSVVLTQIPGHFTLLPVIKFVRQPPATLVPAYKRSAWLWGIRCGWAIKCNHCTNHISSYGNRRKVKKNWNSVRKSTKARFSL